MIKRNRGNIVIIILILLFMVYRLTGLYGNYVLIGLSCRNIDFLIIAIILIKWSLKIRRDRPGMMDRDPHMDTRGKRWMKTISEYTLLMVSVFFLGAFLYCQSNVVLDIIVPSREGNLTECQIKKTLLPSLITGYSAVLSGVNENGYTKTLPLTRELEKKVDDEIKEKGQVDLIFLEHVRRVVMIRTNSAMDFFDRKFN